MTLILSQAGRDLYARDILGDAIHLSMHLNEPGETGLFEFAGNNYRRLAIPAAAWMFDGTGAAETSTQWEFDRLTADISPLAYFGAFTESAGGIFLGSQALETPITVKPVSVIRFRPGSITLRVA